VDAAVTKMPAVKECINIHIGQAGCQVGARTWELFTEEHAIAPDGTRDLGSPDIDFEDDSFSSFFHETGSGQFVPRSVFIDTEPTVINDIKASKWGSLFHPESLIAFKQDCKSNFFEGRTMASAFKIQDVVLDRIRLAAELCGNLQGFFAFHSVGGGTGSGVAVEVLHDLRDMFDKKAVFQPVIYPSQHYSSCIVEPYNCIFATHFTRDVVDLSIMLDNQAVYNICDRNLQIKNPHFFHVNHIIAQCISGVTGPLRYETQLNATLPEIQSNIVPCKQFRYTFLSLAPIRHEARRGHEAFNTEEIVKELFEEQNTLCDCVKLSSNRYLAAVLIMRGGGAGPRSADPGKPRETEKYVSTNAVLSTLNDLKHPPASKSHARSIKFVPWMEGSGVKVGIVNAKPVTPSTKGFPLAPATRQGILLGNNTAIRQLFVRQYLRFLKLYYHKAYVWQFIGANGDDDTFAEAKESVRGIIDEYEVLMRDVAAVEGERLGRTGSGRVSLVGGTERAEQRFTMTAATMAAATARPNF